MATRRETTFQHICTHLLRQMWESRCLEKQRHVKKPAYCNSISSAELIRLRVARVGISFRFNVFCNLKKAVKSKLETNKCFSLP